MINDFKSPFLEFLLDIIARMYERELNHLRLKSISVKRFISVAIDSGVQIMYIKSFTQILKTFPIYYYEMFSFPFLMYNL